MISKEIWRPISGTNGCYQISNLGNIYSYRGALFKSIRPLRPWKTTGGYLCIDIVYNEIRKTSKVHRLVALAFLPNPNNYRVVNHINGIKTDNRLENLEWCTHSENNQHAWDMGLKPKLYGADNGNAVLTWDQVDEIRELGKQKVKVKNIAIRFSVSEPTIWKILGNRKYIKKYA